VNPNSYGLIPISQEIADQFSADAAEYALSLQEQLGWVEETPERKQAREERARLADEHRAKMDALYDCGEHEQNFDTCGQCHDCLIGENK
jgi:7-cyano-7-deazaguanine synthase in queuosine biosynthesis